MLLRSDGCQATCNSMPQQRAISPGNYKADACSPAMLLHRASYMVTRHPEVVFSQMGQREAALTTASQCMLDAFEAVLHRVLEVQRSRPTTASLDDGTLVVSRPRLSFMPAAKSEPHSCNDEKCLEGFLPAAAGVSAAPPSWSGTSKMLSLSCVATTTTCLCTGCSELRVGVRAG